MKIRTNGAAEPARPDEDSDPKPKTTASGGGTRAEERIAGLDTSGATLSEMVEQLTQELEEAKRALEEAEAGWQRTRADFANFKRRSETTQAENAGRANDALLLKVVGLADDFDLAIEHVPEESKGTPWLEGIDAIDRKLRQLLESQGVSPIEAEGQPFDPHEHQAISYEDTDEAADGTVLKELQRGYYIRDRVLRPAFVAVARNEGSSADDQQHQTPTTNSPTEHR